LKLNINFRTATADGRTGRRISYIFDKHITPVKAKVVFVLFPFLPVKEICSAGENSELFLLQKTCTDCMRWQMSWCLVDNIHPGGFYLQEIDRVSTVYEAGSFSQ
jgi:hypothetical protein